MDSCYKCKHYKVDYNYTNSRNFCANTKSQNYTKAIENITECNGCNWELLDEFPLCERCIHYEGCHSTIFGECWTCGKKHPNSSDIRDNDWNWFEENKSIIECEYYVYGEPLVNVVLG